jgi:hypothetical protein
MSLSTSPILAAAASNDLQGVRWLVERENVPLNQMGDWCVVGKKCKNVFGIFLLFVYIPLFFSPFPSPPHPVPYSPTPPHVFLTHLLSISSPSLQKNNRFVPESRGSVKHLERKRRTPAMIAALHGSLEVLGYLLQSGADPNVRSEDDERCTVGGLYKLNTAVTHSLKSRFFFFAAAS